MSYTGQTHQIPCNAGGLNATPNQELMDSSAMISGSKNLNLTDGGRQKRGGTAHINATEVGKSARIITGADAGTETFEISSSHGDVTALFPAGGTFTVTGSTGNDATWTVDSSSFDNTNTLVGVTGDITDATGDGSAYPLLDIALNGIFDYKPVDATNYIILTGNNGTIWTSSTALVHSGWTANKITSMEQFDSSLFICNGYDIPQVFDASVLATATRDIGNGGISVPGACVAALAATPIAGNVDDGTHYYKVTFVNAHGETTVGTASNVVTVADKTTNGKVELTAIPTGASGVTSRRLWRTKAGAGTYYLLAAISDNTTTTYTDNIADSAISTAVPAANTALSLPTDWAGTNYPKQVIKHGRGNSQRLWYLGCPSTPYTVYVSPNNLPEDLDDGSVSTLKIDTGDSFGLVGGTVMNDKLFVFGKRQTYVIDDADTTVSNWGYVEAPWRGGVSNHRLIVRTPNDVVCMTDTGDIYSVNAAQQYGDFQQASLVRPSFIHKWILDNVDLAYIANFHAIYDPSIRAIKFFVTSEGSSTNDMALVYFVDRGPVDGWMVHDNADNDSGYNALSAAMIYVGAGNYEMYTGDYTGQVWSLEQTTKSDNSLYYYAGFKTPLNGLTENRGNKNFKRGFLIVDPVDTETIAVIPTVDDVELNEELISVESGKKNYEFNIGFNGKRIQYEIYNKAAGEDFFISQVLTDLRPLGKEPE